MMRIVAELKNISIAHVNYMVLQAMCRQCKTEVQANLTMPTAKSDTLVYASECTKCFNTLAAAYKFMPVHINNRKDLGYIGLVGLEIKDVLPCNFKIQCGGCDALSKLQNVQAALDSHGVCTKCGKATKLKINKYQVVNSTWEGTDKAWASSKMKATAHANMKKDRTQKIKAGQPLPDNGVCKHYRKSYINDSFCYTLCRIYLKNIGSDGSDSPAAAKHTHVINATTMLRTTCQRYHYFFSHIYKNIC